MISSSGYLKECFAEAYQDDGLLVLGKGLGLTTLCTKFVQCYSSKGGSGGVTSDRLVLVINGGDLDRKIRDTLAKEGVPDEDLPDIINNEVSSQDRMDMYMLGGCYFVTSRILIVDLLDNKLDPTKITGILIFNAHRISETSLESFIIRVYREKNRTGFIKAFTEDPELLTNGYMKVERLLRSLYLQRLFLWPRFRSEVVEAFAKCHQPEVIELSLPLSKNATSLQSAILVAMNTCLKELKRSCPTLDTSQWTLENGLFQHFDLSIRAQLDPEWHRISYRTKQIVSDLSVLRKLLDYLVRYDGFSFHHLLSNILTASKEMQFPSLWLTSSAAEDIFKFAKARIYRLIPSNGDGKWRRHLSTQEVINTTLASLELTKMLDPVAECPPKCKLLEEVLREIYAHIGQSPEGGAINEGIARKGGIMVVVRDDLALNQVKDVLLHGTKYVMDHKYRWFIAKQAREIGLRHRKAQSRDQAIRLNRPNRSAGAGRANPTADNSGDVGDMEWNDDIIRKILEDDEDDEGNAGEEEGPGVRETSAETGQGFLSLGLDEAQVRSLPEEQQLILLQNRLLKLIPPEKSHQADTVKDVDGSIHRARDVIRKILVRNDPALSKQLTKDTALPSTARRENGKKRKKPSENLVVEVKKEPRHLLSHTVIFTSLPSSGTMAYASSTAASSSSSGALRGVSLEDLLPDDDAMADNDDDEVDQQEALLEFQSKRKEIRDKLLASEMHVVLMTHAQLREQGTEALAEIQPQYVVLYDSEAYIVRLLETYQMALPRQLKVYFFMYEGSTEEHRYTAALVKEKRSFDNLISTKEHMVIALPDHPLDLRKEQAEDLAMISDSRQRKQLSIHAHAEKSIVVDVREFRSSLPSILYSSQYYSHLFPRTLVVGDYVLSPEICVERKGISDLFQSFASGRLYNQCEAMVKYYKYPCVLIEFQPDKSFCLVAPADIPSEIRTHSITSNLVLLTQSFPSLKLLWSRSPQSTAEIFRSIATHHDPVDVQKAVAVGGGAENKDNEEEWVLADPQDRGGSMEDNEDARQAATNILLSLPGINVHNFREVMHQVENLAELAKMSEKQLAPMIGQANAMKLVAFFRQRIL